MKKKIMTTAITALMLISLISVFQAGTASAQGEVPDRVTAITTAADRLVALQSSTDYGWDWIITGLPEHSGNPSAYNMYGVVILGLLDAYEETNDESYLEAATGMANHMTQGDASEGNFYKQGGEQEPAGAYDYQFLIRYATISGNPTYSDYAKALWDWNKVNTAIFASPSALNDALLEWGYGSADPGAAAWQLAAFGTAIHAMGDNTFATGCADLIVTDLDPNGLEYLVGDHMALAECLEFLSQLDPATYSGTIERIITDLVTAQKADGCWDDGYAGTFQDTAYAVRALAVYGGTDGQNAARKGAAWLISNQLVNGGWIDNSDPDHPQSEFSEQDAEGLRALVATEAPVTIDENGYYSIQQAIDSANSNDTINVAAGIYSERITINKSLTVRSVDGAEVTTINAQGLEFGVLINGMETVATFDGFTVENYLTAGILAGAFSLEDDPLEVHILNNIVKQPIGQKHNNCIQVGDGTTGTVIGNEVSGAFLEDPLWSGSGIIVAGSSDVVVSNNYVHNCESGIVILGYMYKDPDAPAVNNIVENNLVEKCEAGISIEALVMDTTIENNWVTNNSEVGIQVYAYDNLWNKETSAPTGTEIHYNNIVGNGEGVVSGVWEGDNPTGIAAEVDATLNWWGNPTGPRNPTTNPSATGDNASDNVDYTPWLDAPYLTGVARSWNVQNVDTGENFNSIQAAIDAADNGETVLVHPGIYDQNLVINKPLTLQGEDRETTIIQSTLDLTYGDRVIIVESSDVTVTGVTISGYTGTEEKRGSTSWGIYADGEFSNIEVTNNIFTFYTQGGIRFLDVENSVISGNIFKRETRSVWYDPAGTEPGSYVDRTYGGMGPELWGGANCVIYNNTISTYAVGIFLMGPENTLVENNLVSAPDTEEPSDSGIHIQSCSDTTIRGNVVENFTAGPKKYYKYGTTGAGIRLGGTNCNVEKNTLTNNTVGVLVTGATEGCENNINRNNIEGNTEFGVLNCAMWVGETKTYTPATTTVDATYNYWGHPSGPGRNKGNGKGKGPGRGDRVSENVRYQPWLTKPFQTVLEKHVGHYGFKGAHLGKGWNTLSVPIYLDNNAWERIAAYLDENIAYRFDASTQAWELMTTNSKLDPLDAIYIRMNSENSVPLVVSVSITNPPVKELKRGWNLIGLAAWEVENMSVDRALVSVELTPDGNRGYTIVVSSSLNQEYWAYTIGQTKKQLMHKNEGYWVYMENPGNLAGFSTTPLPFWGPE